MNWEIKNEKLTKTYTLKSFNDIIEKLNIIAKVADENNHHPDFEVFAFNKITFNIFSHDKNKITDSDYKLSKAIDDVFLGNFKI